jgi:ATP-dependent protease ClpP protease subunit
MQLSKPHYNFKPKHNKKPKTSNNDEPEISVTVSNNHIYFHADVCDESVAKLITIINNKNDEYKKLIKNDIIKKATPQNLWLHITSYGGCLFSCFRAIDAITNSTIPIYTVIDGYAASAGTLMSVVGKKRYMTKNAYMLIHQLSSGARGNFWQIKDEYINLEMLMDDIYNIYIDNSKMDREDLEAYLAHDSWWKFDKCLECGLVDEMYIC